MCMYYILYSKKWTHTVQTFVVQGLTVLTNWNQQHVQRIMHHNQVGSIPGIQGLLNVWNSISVTWHINRMKPHMIISIDTRKSIWQNSTLSHYKNTQVGIEKMTSMY